MTENAPPLLSTWGGFYEMTGSSAAALTGLMFVVISLAMGREQGRSQDGIATFSTPTVTYFGTVLLVSATLVAPWHSLRWPGATLALAGLFGVTYVARVMRRTKRLSTYTADVEDWVWYNILPLLAYGAICAGGIGLYLMPQRTLFAIAAAVVLLIFIGIRNAWDVVTFIAMTGGPAP